MGSASRLADLPREFSLAWKQNTHIQVFFLVFLIKPGTLPHKLDCTKIGFLYRASETSLLIFFLFRTAHVSQFIVGRKSLQSFFQATLSLPVIGQIYLFRAFSLASASRRIFAIHPAAASCKTSSGEPTMSIKG